MDQESEIQILIVEDSPTQAMILSKGLKEKGFKTDIVKNGKQGLSFLEKNSPDVVISDIIMPEMDGFQLCKKIREDPGKKNLMVILYTALYDPKEVLKAISCGANYFLTKPARLELILGFIDDFTHMQKTKEDTHPIDFFCEGKMQTISADLNKVSTLLLSTYRNAIEKNKSLEIAQRELKEKNISLQMLNDQKNAILGMAAHDLRNPLGVIKSYGELLQEMISDKVEKDVVEIIQTIKKSSDKMLQLVNELLDISSIESGKVILDFKENNLKSMFEKNIQINKNIAQKKQIGLVLKVEGDIPTIYCDEAKIEQVLTNFITNAIKYSYPNTEIIVQILVDKDFFIFSVTDQGQGIPKNEQNKLFKSFTKTTVKTTGGETSTGLGLAITKKIIDAHHGEIGVESEEKKGSTFFAKIPLKQPKK